MKKILLIGLGFLTAFGFTGCNKSGNGELIGVQNRGRWKEPSPYGMVHIRRGSVIIGPNDEDPAMMETPVRTYSVNAFWMDDTEITNNEYRQFVHWTRDKIARELLGEQFPEFLIIEDRDGNPIDPPEINWDEPIYWDDPDYILAMEELFISENERFYGKREVDPRKLFYDYWWIDYQQAARRANAYNYETQQYDGSVIGLNGEQQPIQNRSSFIFNDRVNVYPDTLVWIRDFTYSYNEPWASRYFWHPGFDDYPVVGITWKQAKAFCNWRTKVQTDYLVEKGEPALMEYRLPTEVEWEYASRGGRLLTMYPWGNYYARDDQGVFYANFKPLRGNYVEDGGIATMKVGSYAPNDFGLYDMAGNVAEWTNDAYDESGYMYYNELNPSFEYNALPDDPPVMKRKVIRGGSWKDISYFIRTSSRSFEYQDTTKSYIGFRCVRTTLGEDF